MQITDKDFKKIKKELEAAEKGLYIYAATLSDTWVCSKHLDTIYQILEKYEEGVK